MERPVKFEHNRWVGDRRNQVAYDVDNIVEPSIIEDLMKATDMPGIHGVPYTCFGPDTLAEARNRGYKPYKGNGSGDPDIDVDTLD